MKQECPSGRNTVQALREIDEIHGTKFAPLVDELIEGGWRADWSDALDKPRGGEAQVAVVRRVLAHGLTITETGRVLGLTPKMVASVLTHTPQRADELLGAEMLLREHNLSHAHIATRLGLSSQAVNRLAVTLGVRSPHAERKANGGGWVHPSATYRRMEQLRADGLSHGHIAKELGMSRNTVKSFFHRKVAA